MKNKATCIRVFFNSARGFSKALTALVSTWLLFLSIAQAQPALPQMEIFWIEKIPTDSVVVVKVTWYPSATLDTNEVQFIEYDHNGLMLKTCGVKSPSDTVIKVTILSEGFRQNSIVFLRWRAYNAEGDSGWSDVMWFATNEMTSQPILLQPIRGSTVKEE